MERMAAPLRSDGLHRGSGHGWTKSWERRLPPSPVAGAVWPAFLRAVVYRVFP